MLPQDGGDNWVGNDVSGVVMPCDGGDFPLCDGDLKWIYVKRNTHFLELFEIHLMKTVHFVTPATLVQYS